MSNALNAATAPADEILNALRIGAQAKARSADRRPGLSVSFEITGDDEHSSEVSIMSGPKSHIKKVGQLVFMTTREDVARFVESGNQTGRTEVEHEPADEDWIHGMWIVRIWK